MSRGGSPYRGEADHGDREARSFDREGFVILALALVTSSPFAISFAMTGGHVVELAITGGVSLASLVALSIETLSMLRA
jgi:hypothetical protein